MFWPRIASDVKDYVSKCDVCLAYRTSQTKEPLLQHEVISRPWAKVAADLCETNGRPHLVVSDYFSNFIEVSRLHAITTKAVVRELKTIFARFGIPEILVTDNGPQFASNEFKAFAKSWSFNHTTTSPRYPQSNGKGESPARLCVGVLRPPASQILRLRVDVPLWDRARLLVCFSSLFIKRKVSRMLVHMIKYRPWI